MTASSGTSGTPLLRVIDLETTGQGYGDGGVVEIGWQDLSFSDDFGTWELSGGPAAKLVNPGHPISPSTSAIHHIIDADVADAPAFHLVTPPILRVKAPFRLVALVAHRAAFEQRWCLPALTGGTRWICTYKSALRLWPDAPTHSNQGLRYWRNPPGLNRALGLPAHRAGPDAYVTAHLLREMLSLTTVDQLLAWSAEPALLARIPFGPLRGRRLADLDDAMLDRILGGDAGGNADIMFSARIERQRRGGIPQPPPAQAILTL